MTSLQRRTALIAVLGMSLALSLAACGSESADTSATITFRSDPPAQVWIAGESKGTTPVVLALDAGSHPVAFKADGFESATQEVTVEAGKDLTIEAVLRGASTDESTVTLLASVLGIEHRPFEEPALHRGGGDASVMLYWPQRDVRKDSLTSFRIDVTEDYEGDGFIEFRKGSKVLHREPFNPASYETVKAMPEAVREAIKAGSKVKWGVYFESRRKKAITTDFKVISSSKIERKLAKLETSKFFRRQTPLMQEMLRVDVLRNNRLYSEALVHSLGILQANPGTTSPFKPIVESLQRLKLKDTPLFAYAATKVGGKGQNLRPAPASGLGTGGLNPGATQAFPPVLSGASLVAKAKEATEKAADEATGQGTFDKGAGGGTSGVYVRPTPEAAKDPIAGAEAVGPGTVLVDPEQIERDRALALQTLRRSVVADLESTKQLLSLVEDTEKRFEEASAEVDATSTALRLQREASEAAHAAVDSKEETAATEQQKLDDLVNGGALQADIDAQKLVVDQAAQDVAAAQQAASEATAAEQGAMEQFENARENLENTARETREVLERTGSADQLKERIATQEAELERLDGTAKGRPEPGTTVPVLPGVPVDPTAPAPAPTAEAQAKAFEEAQGNVQSAQERNDEAVENLGRVMAEVSDAQVALTAQRAASVAAHDGAYAAQENAATERQKLDDLVTGGAAQALIDAQQLVVDQAEQDATVAEQAATDATTAEQAATQALVNASEEGDGARALVEETLREVDRVLQALQAIEADLSSGDGGDPAAGPTHQK